MIPVTGLWGIVHYDSYYPLHVTAATPANPSRFLARSTDSNQFRTFVEGRNSAREFESARVFVLRALL
jgi:hypothetical protein